MRGVASDTALGAATADKLLKSFRPPTRELESHRTRCTLTTSFMNATDWWLARIVPSGCLDIGVATNDVMLLHSFAKDAIWTLGIMLAVVLAGVGATFAVAHPLRLGIRHREHLNERTPLLV